MKSWCNLSSEKAILDIWIDADNGSVARGLPKVQGESMLWHFLTRSTRSSLRFLFFLRDRLPFIL